MFGGGSCFGPDRLSAVAVGMWISVPAPWLHLPLLSPHARPAPIKPGKSRLIVAKGTRIRRSNPRHPRGPVEPAFGVNAHPALVDDRHHPVAIELHFVEPVRPDRGRALAAKAGPAVKSVPATRSRCRVPLCQDFGMPLFSVSRRGAFHSLFSEETRAPALDWARRPQLAPAQPVIPPRCRISACALAEPA